VEERLFFSVNCPLCWLAGWLEKSSFFMTSKNVLTEVDLGVPLGISLSMRSLVFSTQGCKTGGHVHLVTDACCLAVIVDEPGGRRKCESDLKCLTFM